MELSVNIVADSIGAENGVRLPTIEVVHPRFILAEVNTHRVLTRNGASSRAIPLKKQIENLRQNYAKPLQWLMNAPGMVTTEVMPFHTAQRASDIWFEAMEDAIKHATNLAELGASKQYVNRLIEPFMMQKTLISSTRWANFFKLRDHKDAQPEFGAIAKMIVEALEDSTPVVRSRHDTFAGWHRPYTYSDAVLDDVAKHSVHHGDDLPIPDNAYAPTDVFGIKTLLASSAAKCCRVSYRGFDDRPTTVAEDLSTFGKLISDPLHASPLEHIAFPLSNDDWIPELTGNFHGWVQLRHIMPNESADEVIAALTAYGQFHKE